MKVIFAGRGVGHNGGDSDWIPGGCGTPHLKRRCEAGGLIREHLLEILQASERAPARVAEPPAVVLVVGVNGSGKTTTIGKLAQRFQNEKRSVLLCAADTFRAAAIEQLEIWGERTRTPVVRQKAG